MTVIIEFLLFKQYLEMEGTVMIANGLDAKTIRYSRQIIMDEIGKEGQEKLFNAKVLVIGAGGLGCPILTYLVGAGVGTIGIVDFDTVGLSNLHRQTLYRTEDIGKKKVHAAKETLSKLNDEVTIHTYPVRIDVDNIEELIRDYDIVVDALDNFSARYLLSDACYFQKKTLVEGAVVSTYGTATTIIPDVTPCYRCIYPVPPADGVTPTCSDVGVLGMIPGIIGCIQALEVIKVIVGFGKPLYGRMAYFDGSYLEMQEFEYKKSDECPICGKNPSIVELEQYEIKCKLKLVDTNE